MTTLQRQCAKNLKQILPEMKLQGVVPNSHIHVPVSDLYCTVYSHDQSAYCAAAK
jgi:hypothetical protein